MESYIALVRKDPETDYGVDFPDFPGCVSGAASYDAALEGGREALALHIEGLLANGAPIPAPSTFEAVLADPDNRDALAVEIAPYPIKTKSVKYTATMDEALLARVDRAAAAGGDSRSGFLAEACRRRLDNVPVPGIDPRSELARASEKMKRAPKRVVAVPAASRKVEVSAENRKIDVD